MINMFLTLMNSIASWHSYISSYGFCMQYIHQIKGNFWCWELRECCSVFVGLQDKKHMTNYLILCMDVTFIMQRGLVVYSRCCQRSFWQFSCVLFIGMRGNGTSHVWIWLAEEWKVCLYLGSPRMCRYQFLHSNKCI